jgi:hypothetical protein
MCSANQPQSFQDWRTPKNECYDPFIALRSTFQDARSICSLLRMAKSALSPEIGILSQAAGDGREFDSEPLPRDYLGFGTGFALGALVFFFAALAFCFCAACLCVAFGDLSPMNRRVRFLTIGVNTDRRRSDEISRSSGATFHQEVLAPVFRTMSCFCWFCVICLSVDGPKR